MTTSATVSALLRTASLELVVDGALAADVGATIDDLAQRVDIALAVGLIVFGDSFDPNEAADAGAASYPTSIDVPPAPMDAAHASAMRARVAGVPASHAPIAAALHGAHETLRANPATMNGAALITARAPASTGAVVGAANVLHPSTGASVATFVFGAGPFQGGDTAAYDPAFLEELSVAGGAPIPGCDPQASVAANACFDQADSTSGTRAATLRDWVRGVVRDLRGECTFPLPPVRKPGNVNVYITARSGQRAVLMYGDRDGWTYDDETKPTRILIHGGACTAVWDDGSGTIGVVEGCGTAGP